MEDYAVMIRDNISTYDNLRTMYRIERGYDTMDELTSLCVPRSFLSFCLDPCAKDEPANSSVNFIFLSTDDVSTSGTISRCRFMN